MIHLFLKRFSVALFCLSSSMALAGNLGTLTKVVGDVLKVSSKNFEEKKVQKSDPIETSDTLIVKEKSVAQVKLIDGSVLTFGPNTKFNFRNMVYDGKKKRLIEFDLLYGQLRGTISKTDSKNNKVNIHTKTVSLGIRGTEILLNHKIEGVKSELSEVALLTGQAQVRYKKSGKTFKLKPGDYLVAMADPGTSHMPTKMMRLEDKVQQALASHSSGPANPNYRQEGMALAGSATQDESETQIPDDFFLELKGDSSLLKK